MKNIDEQDKIFRDKIEESRFDYDEAYWEKARKMLYARNNRRYQWLWAGAVALLLCITAGVYFIVNENKKSKNEISIKQIETKPEASNNSTKQKVVVASDTAGSKILSNDRSIESDTASVKEYPKANNNSTETNRSYSSSNRKADIASNTKKSAGNNSISAREGLNQGVSEPTPDKYKKVMHTVKRFSNSGAGTKNYSKDSIFYAPDASVDYSETDSTWVDSVKIEPTTARSEIKPAIIEAKKDTCTNNLPVTAKADALIGKRVDSTNAPVIKPPLVDKVDSAYKTVVSNDFIRKQFISINGGVNLNKGIQVTGSRVFQIGALPYGGISYSRSIDRQNKKLLEVGLQVCAFGSVQAQKVIHHSNFYSFGYAKPDSTITGPQPVTDSTFTLKQKSLFIIQLPVSFNYIINERNSINIGAGLSYTLNVYSDVTDFDANTKKTFGYTQGFVPFNGFVQAGYSYHITSNWLLHLNIQQGLTNMIDNSFLNTGRKYFNTNVQMGLSYLFAIHSKEKTYVKK